MIHDQNDTQGALISVIADRDKWRARAERLKAALVDLDRRLNMPNGCRRGDLQTIVRAALKEEKP